ncbi:putative disease resistance protein RGA3 [Coffea eugenioides]|uniref:putative disease resistance protein RGA3 n=1 Tax=Coffea eugenioides TaxID=49369 RepID=UPI000F60D442|nr:putative disease resistance protein RGA3 [Coffea eugenioides]
MADALISSTIQVTLERTLSLASDRVGLLVGFKKDVASMTLSLGFIKDVLADAEERQNQSSGVQRWLKCLDEVAYDAQNVLDELHYESLRHQVESRNRHKLKVCCFFSFSNINLAFRWRMASKVRDIKLKLKEINQQAREFGLDSKSVVPAALPAAGDTRNRQTDSVVVPMIGRTDDESHILEMLLRPSEKVVSVLPIFGMGGLGKTTLAKSIYNNHQIDGHFQKKIWVCVSEKVPRVELFKLILGQLKDKKDEVGDRQNIVQEVGKELGNIRYLLVLDDVWDDNQALWDDFFTTLKGLNPINPPKGSWCLITTRLHLVADKGYPLGRLPGDHCWSIIKGKVVEGEEVPNELDAIKDRAIQICHGLPLVASVLGGLLRLRKDKWRSILEDRLLNLNEAMQILQLSFDSLPSPAIKKCFAYCSIFPKDTEMEGDMLIELWMAEGFLQVDLKKKTLVNKTMEEIGEYYLEILLQSSLLEEIRKYGRRRCYKMHDMVHDVSKSIMSKSTKFINSETGSGDNSNQVRCLVIDSFGEGTINLFESRSNLLHTLFLSQGSLSSDMLMELKSLYVLNLSGVKNQNLPISIGKLIHLRYINFKDSRSETLPESVCKLYNLQTLRLNSGVLKVLPKGMRDFISLRHLHYYNGDEEFQMPLQMGQLTCLQTLELFNVSREKGRQIGELGSLKNLKGKLEINNLELVKGKEGAEEAKLYEKANLFRLELGWACHREGDNYNDEDVLDGLRPHPNLEELVIWYFMGDQFPGWLMKLPTTTTLPKLARLEFSRCNRCRELPPLQNFTSLKELEIFSCDGLTNLPGLFGLPHMESLPPQIQYLTALTSLSLHDFGGIKDLPDWFGNFAALEVLRLWGLKELRHLPSKDAMRSLTKLKRLWVIGSPLLKERCIPESSGPDSQWIDRRIASRTEVRILKLLLRRLYG